MQTCTMNTSRTSSDVEAKLPASNELKEPLQLRLPVSVKRQFKACAALRGCEPHQLFVEVWKHYQQTVGTRVGDLS